MATRKTPGAGENPFRSGVESGNEPSFARTNPDSRDAAPGRAAEKARDAAAQRGDAGVRAVIEAGGTPEDVSEERRAAENLLRATEAAAAETFDTAETGSLRKLERSLGGIRMEEFVNAPYKALEALEPLLAQGPYSAGVQRALEQLLEKARAAEEARVRMVEQAGFPEQVQIGDIEALIIDKAEERGAILSDLKVTFRNGRIHISTGIVFGTLDAHMSADIVVKNGRIVPPTAQNIQLVGGTAAQAFAKRALPEALKQVAGMVEGMILDRYGNGRRLQSVEVKKKGRSGRPQMQVMFERPDENAGSLLEGAPEVADFDLAAQELHARINRRLGEMHPDGPIRPEAVSRTMEQMFGNPYSLERELADLHAEVEDASALDDEAMRQFHAATVAPWTRQYEDISYRLRGIMMGVGGDDPAEAEILSVLILNWTQRGEGIKKQIMNIGRTGVLETENVGFSSRETTGAGGDVQELMNGLRAVFADETGGHILRNPEHALQMLGELLKNPTAIPAANLAGLIIVLERSSRLIDRAAGRIPEDSASVEGLDHAALTARLSAAGQALKKRLERTAMATADAGDANRDSHAEQQAHWIGRRLRRMSPRGRAAVRAALVAGSLGLSTWLGMDSAFASEGVAPSPKKAVAADVAPGGTRPDTGEETLRHRPGTQPDVSEYNPAEPVTRPDISEFESGMPQSEIYPDIGGVVSERMMLSSAEHNPFVREWVEAHPGRKLSVHIYEEFRKLNAASKILHPERLPDPEALREFAHLDSFDHRFSAIRNVTVQEFMFRIQAEGDRNRDPQFRTFVERGNVRAIFRSGGPVREVPLDQLHLELRDYLESIPNIYEKEAQSLTLGELLRVLTHRGA